MIEQIKPIEIQKKPELVNIFPGVFWAINKPFTLVYRDFSTDETLVKKKIVSSKIQARCTERFLKRGTKPQNYVICSSPDYTAALLFAGYLVTEFIAKYGSSKVLWYHMNNYTPDPFLANLDYRPSLIVLSTIYPDTGLARLTQVRDLVSMYWNVPKLIIGTGMDPITLAAVKLHIPANSVYYHQSSLVKTSFNVM